MLYQASGSRLSSRTYFTWSDISRSSPRRRLGESGDPPTSASTPLTSSSARRCRGRERRRPGMAVLTSEVVRDETFERRRASMEAPRRRASRAHGARGGRRRREGGRAPSLAREAHRARAHRPPRRPRHRLPRAERSRRVGALRRRRAVGRHRHRDRRRRGPAVRDRRERRDREGRLVLPAHGEEAPARAGGRPPEPPAVPLPRRLGRGVPPAAGRGLPRPRPLRADLLQPGAAVRARDPADRDRHGLVHRRRRVRARDVGRDRDRARERGRSSSAARRS